MERRKILLGSGTVLATALAGCAGVDQNGGTDDPESDNGDDTNNGDRPEDSPKSPKDGEGDPNQDNGDKDNGDKPDEQTDIPGFNRDDFNIDSDVIKLKYVEYHDHVLSIHVMLRTTDREILVEELRTLAPGFANAVEDANSDEFFDAVKKVKLVLYDPEKTKLLAVFVNVEWLRECLYGDMSNEELAERIVDRVEQAGNTSTTPL